VKAGRDLDEEGVLKEERKPWVLQHLLASCPDFANEISDMQHLGNVLSDDTCTVTVDFTLKYHCEIAGEGIENAWGFSKKLHRHLPLSKKRKIEVFTKSVKERLFAVTPVRARRFAWRTRKYMLAYFKIDEEAGGDNVSASHD
jgi:hypothetical protein